MDTVPTGKHIIMMIEQNQKLTSIGNRRHIFNGINYNNIICTLDYKAMLLPMISDTFSTTDNLNWVSAVPSVDRAAFVNKQGVKGEIESAHHQFSMCKPMSIPFNPWLGIDICREYNPFTTVTYVVVQFLFNI